MADTATNPHPDFLIGYIESLISAGSIVTDGDMIRLPDYAGLAQETLLGDLARRMREDYRITQAALDFYHEHQEVLDSLQTDTEDPTPYRLGWELSADDLPVEDIVIAADDVLGDLYNDFTPAEIVFHPIFDADDALTRIDYRVEHF